MTQRTFKNIFVDGIIEPAFIADCIARHSSKTAIGGHSIFLGQVRADVIDGKNVTDIIYTAYEAMALEQADGDDVEIATPQRSVRGRAVWPSNTAVRCSSNNCAQRQEYAPSRSSSRFTNRWPTS